MKFENAPWCTLYKAALFEMDSAVLARTIDLAEKAIAVRLLSIESPAEIELSRLNDAQKMLGVLRRELERRTKS